MVRPGGQRSSLVSAMFPENFVKEQETTMSNAINLISDPDVIAFVSRETPPDAAFVLTVCQMIAGGRVEHPSRPRLYDRQHPNL